MNKPINNKHSMKALSFYIGQKLRTLRVSKNKTQAEIGLIIGRDRTQVYRAENGTHNLSVEHLYVLSQYFGVKIEYFLPKYDWYLKYKSREIKKITRYEIV